ncbi:MAG: DUF4271 domain-containing protein [Pedobacter sp.]|nr:DUF4271 domain-containing protein [Pedobacter sp.]MDQ8053000.1 DUF4271 domain-containing protein [Pedobacter sp.]
MSRKALGPILLLIAIFSCFAKAQDPHLNIDSLRKIYFLPDTVDSAQVAVVNLPDTITPKTLKPLDSAAIAAIADSLSKGYGYEKIDFKVLIDNFLRHSISTDPHQKGEVLPKGELWVLLLIAGLLVIFAVLKHIFSRQLFAIVQSFFSNRVLGNLNKEDNLFNSWPFLLLFVQFGFTIGMFFYLVAQSQQLEMAKNGFQFFISISIGVIALYALKILLLRLLGLVFSVQKPVTEYVSILYLSYFNTSLLFIPLVVAFALSPLKYASLYIAIAVVLLIVIFVFQFIRAGVNILSNYRFSKVYLFLYFCTLEICPILILIKAIGF